GPRARCIRMLLWGLVPGLILGLISGGRLRSLAQHQLRAEWLLVPLVVVVSILPALRFPASDWTLVLVAWVLPMVLCVAVAALNLRQPGFPIVLAGLVSNLLVVVANHAMPVLARNASLISGSADIAVLLSSSWLHEPAVSSTYLLFLADVIPVPGPAGLRGMASLGDLLLVVGIIHFVFLALHSQPPGLASER
ncbi:MAG: DUF5317 family protein, partial [Coriobacteriia bacterium]